MACLPNKNLAAALRVLPQTLRHHHQPQPQQTTERAIAEDHQIYSSESPVDHAAAMDVDDDVAAHAQRSATRRENRTGTTTVATRLAAICDRIELLDAAGGTPLSAREVATISAMIDDLAGTTTTTDSPERKAAGRMSNNNKRRSSSSMCKVGSYEEACTLGKGGSGVVVAALHRATGQKVAVKSRCSGTAAGDVEIRDLLREASFMAACRGHPSLASFHAVARHRRAARGYSLVMEYVGPDPWRVLRHRHRHQRDGRPFQEAEVRNLMRQLLDGAAEMHRHGIVHRDIKPENILVVHGHGQREGGGGAVVKICDFGVAKSTYEKTVPERTLVAGTSAYMAPEMWLWNTDHDTAVDMWSLGCVMAELLTGTNPFDDVKGGGRTSHLYRIFDVLGVPGKRAWRGLNADEGLHDMVRQWQARQRRLGHQNRLRKLIPEEVLSRDGFEVLKGLLTSDPKKRLTAAAALRCPWFVVDVDKNNDTVDRPPVPKTASDDSNVSSWSSLVWRMAISFAGRALELVRPKLLSK